MKERPILFSAPMVLALLNGSKTQTRRIASKLNPKYLDAHCDKSCAEWRENRDAAASMWCPHGQPGDRLWVQEGYFINNWTRPLKSQRRNVVPVNGSYASDETPFRLRLTERESVLFLERQRKTGVSPGRFMYRSLSRLTLEIVSVRVERLREISAADAVMEGIETDGMRYSPGYKDYMFKPHFDDSGGTHKRILDQWFQDPRESFKSLWEFINGPGSWALNPFVWALAFRRIEQPSSEEGAAS